MKLDLEWYANINASTRGPSSAWRPPCAVGPCARGMLEAMLETAQGPEGGIPHWLVPVAALFQLCLASSYMHWMEPPRSYQHLDQLEASLHGAPSGSYAEAVSPALHARSTLLRAFLALRERRHAAAEVAAGEAQLGGEGWDLSASTGAWHLATSAFVLCGRRGTYGTGLAMVAPLGAWDAAPFLRGRGGTWRHLPSFCVAGVALGDMCLHFVWQAWHLRHWAGSGGTFGGLGRRASFAWQAWHLATSAVVLCGRRGTR
eukprot:s442_g2.t1